MARPRQAAPRGVDADTLPAGRRTVARLPWSRFLGWVTHYPTAAQYYTPIASESAASATREKNLHMMPSRRPVASPPPAQQLVAAGQTHAIDSLVPGLDG